MYDFNEKVYFSNYSFDIFLRISGEVVVLSISIVIVVIGVVSKLEKAKETTHCP